MFNMREKIVIFDLKFALYNNFATPYPSLETMAISGYHKAQGDTVVLAVNEPNFLSYDKVYIIKDCDGLYHDPEWLKKPNVVLAGKYWGALEVKESFWYEYPLDIMIYRNWIEDRIERYKNFNSTRAKMFFLEPVLMEVNGNWELDFSGQEVLICDRDIMQKDPKLKKTNQLEVSFGMFLYPFEISVDTVEVVCKFIKDTKGLISRERLWGIIYGIPSIEEQENLIATWNKYKIGRLFQWKLEYKPETDKEWMDSIEPVVDLAYRFKEKAGKRIFIYPMYYETSPYPYFFQILKRWTGSKAVFAKNNLLDYLISDTISSYKQIAQFIIDPIGYMKNIRSKGLKEAMQLLIENPEYLEIVSRPMPGRFAS
jgi:hypothetical protein